MGAVVMISGKVISGKVIGGVPETRTWDGRRVKRAVERASERVLPCLMVELGAHECRYPVSWVAGIGGRSGHWLFCGERCEVSGGSAGSAGAGAGSWCPAHRARVYTRYVRSAETAARMEQNGRKVHGGHGQPGGWAGAGRDPGLHWGAWS